MQEDKEAVFDVVDTVKACLSVFCGMFKTLEFKTGNMYKSALGGYTNATDAADWLVKKGIAFREAHEIAGKLVLYAINKNVRLDELTIDELKKESVIFDDTFYEAVSVEKCVEARALPGGPSVGAVEEAITNAEAFIKNISAS